MAGIILNPMVTTQPYGTFQVTTDGGFQGDFVDDSSSYQYLAGGQIASSVTQPVWGGMAITSGVAFNSPSLGGGITLATATGNVTGFTVFTKNSSAILTAGANNVPLVYAPMTANYFEYGSNARLRLSVAAGVISTLEGGAVNQALYWDPALFQLTASGTAGAFLLPATTKIVAIKPNGKVVTYNSGTGVVAWAAGAVATIQI